MKREYPIYHKDESGRDEDDRYFLPGNEKFEKWKNPTPEGLLRKKRERIRRDIWK